MSDCSCPICGHDLPLDLLHWDPATGVLIGNGRLALLSETPAGMFDLLWRAKGAARSREQIMDHLYQLNPDSEPESKILDVYACKIRAEIAGTGVRIETVWGRGWRLAFDRPAALAGDTNVA